MHTLFEHALQINYANRLVGTFARLQHQSTFNLGKALAYWRESEAVVPSNHLLCRLIKLTPLPSGDLDVLSLDDVRNYYEALRNHDDQYGNALNLTSSSRFGGVQASAFYEDSVDELVIVNSTAFTPEMYHDWKLQNPIQVHRHPYNVPHYGVLSNRVSLGGNGVAVLSINIPLLLTQYVMFLKEQRTRGEAPIPVSKYVVKYPLPNLLKSHNDIAMINRFIDFWYNNGTNTRDVRQPFWLFDELPLWNQVLVPAVSELRRNPVDFDHALLQIPTVYKNGYDAIRLHIDLDMRQNRWAWVIARTWVVSFLLDVLASYKGRQKNGIEKNQIRKALQRIASDGTFYLRGLPPKVKRTIETDLDNINTTLKHG